MTSEEKLNYITNLLFNKLENTNIDLTEEEADNIVNYNKDLRKDLEALETIKENCGLVYEDGNTYFKVNIKEYDYLRRPIEDFDKVKHLAERN